MSSSPIVSVDEVLRLFGRSRRGARKAYGARLQGAAEQEWIGASPGHLPWWSLGRPPRGETEDPEVEYKRRRKAEPKGGDDRPTLEVEEYVELGARALGVSIPDLRSRGRGSVVVRARELLSVVGVEKYRLRVADLARAMSKSPDTLTKAIARATRRRVNDAAERQALDELDAKIAERRNGGMA